MSQTSTRDRWPSLVATYEDEFGQIEPDVFETASRLWPMAERYAERLLGDAAAGFALMMRAVANVTRMRNAHPSSVRHLNAYLSSTYRRLVLAELEKERSRTDLLAAHNAAPESLNLDEEVERRILLDELMRRMDPWTRQVFELLTLGYSFDEIGEIQGRSPQGARNRFRHGVQRLRRAVNPDRTYGAR